MDDLETLREMTRLLISREIVPRVEQSMLVACEFGFKKSEEGWNLDRTLIELKKLMRP